MRPACILVLVLAACGGSGTAESPLEHVVAHLQEHGFEAAEVPPQGDPRPEAMAVVQLQGGTATIYAYGTEEAARTATTHFAAEEQAAPARVRAQREGALVFVGRAPEGRRLPAVDFEDVVFTAEEDH